jgi:hypothetical protein
LPEKPIATPPARRDFVAQVSRLAGSRFLLDLQKIIADAAASPLAALTQTVYTVMHRHAPHGEAHCGACIRPRRREVQMVMRISLAGVLLASCASAQAVRD